jgi:hypothetical protein
MVLLKTHTLSTRHPGTFLVYWTNNPHHPQGLLKVRVKRTIEDRNIVAELAAIKFLLVDKGVLGKDVVEDSNIKLTVSLGAIKKLQHMKSDKVHLLPYSQFLITRFAACTVDVNKGSRWFEGFNPELSEELRVDGPSRETLTVTGLGEVAVTKHVLERFAERALAKSANDKSVTDAWKSLAEAAADTSVHEVARRGMWTAVNQEKLGRPEGRYFLNPQRKLILVVTDTPREGKRLVTTFPASRQFHELPIAA